MLEQASDLHGDIRWFNIILEVFLILWNCGWILLSYFCMIILTFFSILPSTLRPRIARKPPSGLRSTTHRRDALACVGPIGGPSR